ncbi:MAG: SpoIID/LytB domain-containing protein [Phycisphaerales bacterium]
MNRLTSVAGGSGPRLRLARPDLVAAAILIFLTGCGGSAFDSGQPSASTPPAARTSTTVRTSSGAPGPIGVPRAVLPGIAGEPDVRIRLIEAASTATLTSTVRSVWISGGGNRPAARMIGPVNAKLSASGWEFTDAAGLIAKFDRTATVETAAEEGIVGPAVGEAGRVAPAASVRGTGAASAAATPASVILNGKRYAGAVRFVPRSEVSPRAFDVIETVDLEDYLKGVVASEMFSKWPLAAYQSQAVAARSYAVHERDRARRTGQGFDVEANVKDQAYAGLNERSEIVQAVDSTRGVLLTWGGGVLRSYFHSTCGGRASSAGDTWPTATTSAFNQAGPIQAQKREWACNGATYYRWSTVRNRQELLQRFKAFGAERGTPLRGLTGIESIIATSSNAAGRPSRYLVMQPGGQTYTLTAEELRRACNQEVGTLPPISAANRVNSSDMEVALNGNTITITGRGYGHGVGLCQWCAKGFADKGETWQAILTRFYPGAKVERAY